MSWYILGPFIHGTRSDWSQQKHFAWLWPALYCFPVSTLGEKLGYKVLFSRQEAQCQPLVNLFCKMFAQKPLCVCLLKSSKDEICQKPRTFFLGELLPTSADDNRNVSVVWRKLKLLCNHGLKDISHQEKTAQGVSQVSYCFDTTWWLLFPLQGYG